MASLLKKIEPYLNLADAVKALYKTDVKKYVIANYTSLQPTRHELRKFGETNKNNIVENIAVTNQENYNNISSNIDTIRQSNETNSDCPNCLKILYLYPDMLELYGDYGNIQVLKYRIESRGCQAVIDRYSIGDDAPNFNDYDIVFAGGGADNEQSILAEDLVKYKENIQEAVQNGVFSYLFVVLTNYLVNIIKVLRATLFQDLRFLIIILLLILIERKDVLEILL